MESYIGLADIYDKTIDMDYDKWVRFVVDYFKAKEINLRGKKLLELGCGTGNMTLKLREQGMEITAVDLSNEMLHTAMDKALKKRQRILFVNQNIVNFNINKRFDFVFSFCDGYNYITKEEELIKSFERVYSHLNAGGYFLFDISSAYKLKNKIGNNTFTQNEDELSYIWDNYIEKDLLEMYITFFVREGALYKRFKEHHIQRAWENEHIIKCLDKVGFKDINVYNDYTIDSVSDDSLRSVFVCKREE